jgi:hypothetical protein
MLSQKYSELNQDIFTTDVEPEPIWTLMILLYNKARFVFELRRSRILG